jgi:hypothetical protein
VPARAGGGSRDADKNRLHIARRLAVAGVDGPLALDLMHVNWRFCSGGAKLTRLRLSYESSWVARPLFLEKHVRWLNERLCNGSDADIARVGMCQRNAFRFILTSFHSANKLTFMTSSCVDENPGG